MFKIWYWYVSTVDKNAEVIFMNYGFSDENQYVKLDGNSESNRYSIQLYHHLASEVDIENKDVLEIGCGRGGGLSYIANNFSLATAKGVDLSKRAIAFCNKYYKIKGLSFMQGDAQNLNIEDETSDVIFNVESSHRYPDMDAFLGEVKRILRPGGRFLFTDFRFDYELDEMKKALEACGLEIIKERNINNEVIAALKLDNERRINLVERLTPKFIHDTALDFAGCVGSETYNRILTKKYVYFSYVLKKVA